MVDDPLNLMRAMPPKGARSPSRTGSETGRAVLSHAFSAHGFLFYETSTDFADFRRFCLFESVQIGTEGICGRTSILFL